MIVAAIRNRNVKVPEDINELYESDDKDTIAHTSQFRYLTIRTIYSAPCIMAEIFCKTSKDDLLYTSSIAAYHVEKKLFKAH